MILKTDPWDPKAEIELAHGVFLVPHGGRMLALYNLPAATWDKLRSVWSLCPAQDTKSRALLYDWAYHANVMVIANNGVVPPLSRLCKKGKTPDGKKKEDTQAAQAPPSKRKAAHKVRGKDCQPNARVERGRSSAG